jgi:hypothetical protein
LNFVCLGTANFIRIAQEKADRIQKPDPRLSGNFVYGVVEIKKPNLQNVPVCIARFGRIEEGG